MEKKQPKNEQRSFSGWVLESGDSSYNLSDAKAAAKVKATLGAQKFGASAESLSDNGLFSSGYSDYLKSKTFEKLSKANLAAEKKAYQADFKNRQGYEKYVKTYGQLQEKIKSSLIESFAESGMFDTERAYGAAISSGLSSENAMFTATHGVNTAKEIAAKRVIDYANKHSFSGAMAKIYAKSVGLDERYADWVSKKVGEFSDAKRDFYSSLDEESYLELLEDEK